MARRNSGNGGGGALRAIARTVAAGFTGQVADLSTLVKKPATGGARVSGSASITVAAGGAITLAAALAAGASVSAIATITGADLVTAQVPVTITAAGTPAPSPTPTPTPTPTPGIAATTAPTVPAVQYHPHTMAVTTSGSGQAKRVTAATDLRGLANVTEGAAGVGAFERTDSLGRKCWVFEGAEYMNIANALVADQRGIAVFMVMRHHKASANSTFFAQGNAAAGSAANTGNGTVRTSVSGQLAPHVMAHGVSANSVASGKEKLVLGCQPQVVGVVSRPTASGGTRFIIDGYGANAAQPTNNILGILGAELGRYPFSPGVSGTWGRFTLYELLIYTGVLTDAQADAIATSLKNNWDIENKIDTVVVEGDSITDGINEVTSSKCLGMVLSEPGEPQAAPRTWRVINAGVSGNSVADLVTRRDAANSIYANPSSGRNVVAVQIGRNNFASGGMTAQQTYDALVPLINTSSTGYLQRGFEVRYAINIANGGLQATYDAYRVLLKSAQFKTDTLTGPGQTYDGKLALIDLTAITVGGATPFEVPSDASDTTYYQGPPNWPTVDTTHPNSVGTRTMATGGDTPTRLAGGNQGVYPDDTMAGIRMLVLSVGMAVTTPTIAVQYSGWSRFVNVTGAMTGALPPSATVANAGFDTSYDSEATFYSRQHVSYTLGSDHKQRKCVIGGNSSMGAGGVPADTLAIEGAVAVTWKSTSPSGTKPAAKMAGTFGTDAEGRTTYDFLDDGSDTPAQFRARWYAQMRLISGDAGLIDPALWPAT